MTNGDLPETSLSPLYGYEELMGEEGGDSSWPELSENDPATTRYTTATTRTPKGAMFSRRQAYLHSPFTVLAELGISEEANMIHVVLMFHAHSSGGYAATWAGAEQVYPERFNVKLFCESIEREKVNIFFFVPTILNMILNFPHIEKYDLSSLKDIYYGGSATPRAMMEAAVIGVPYDKWCEVARAYVVLKEEHRGKVGEEELLEYLSDKVAKWQIPKSVGFYYGLPKNSVGKIARRVLREGQ